MSDERKRPEPNPMGRREALLWLLGAPVPLGLIAAALTEQQAPRNLRIVQSATPSADSPIARRMYPRTFLSPGTRTALRSQLARAAAFRARWQTAISQFETGSGTKWTANPVVDVYTLAFAAFLVCVRGTGDQGLTWGATR